MSNARDARVVVRRCDVGGRQPEAGRDDQGGFSCSYRRAHLLIFHNSGVFLLALAIVNDDV